jgi:hypothetical protein
MDRETMLKRLEAGYEPIDISIEHWLDIKKAWKNGNYAPFGSSNCALCETNKENGCVNCPLSLIGDQCTQSSSYEEAIQNLDADIMLTALYKAKKYLQEQKCKEIKPEGKSLVDELTFSEKKEEVFYHVGQRFRFKDDGDEYILAFVNYLNDKQCMFIDLESGFRWSSGAVVVDYNKITKEELIKIIGEIYTFNDFELIEDKDAE